MWAIVSIDELSFFEAERRLVGILIAQEFDRHALDWVFDAWQELHFLSHMNWHIAVPCRKIPDSRRPERRDFDVQLSNRLREMYGISRRETPVLVLDNFIEEERQLYLPIGTDERSRKAMFTSMAEFIDKRMSEIHFDGRPDHRMRRALIDDLYNHMQVQALGANVLKLAPHAASAAAKLLRGGH
ncbi:MAG: hypothetical protein WBA88_00575 [Pseudaminobacter sp.]